MVLSTSKSKIINKRAKEIFNSLQEHRESNAYIGKSLDLEKIKSQLEESSEKKNNPLKGCLYSVKDLISNTEGIVTGGSRFLESYYPPYNATVYKLLKEAGAINVVNANLDEFGLGGSGLFGYGGAIENPVNKEYITGGSSSGSAYLCSKKLVEFSICSDTGDSSRYPASLCGIFGFKPSHGTVSRHGFYPFCSGFDTPSIISHSLQKIAEVFSVISCPDPKDLKTYWVTQKNYVLELDKPLKEIRVAVLKDLFWQKGERSKTSLEVQEKFERFVENLKKQPGIVLEIYDYPQHLLKLFELIYAVVSYVEGVSNYSNMTGFLFPFENTESGVKPTKLNSGKNYHEILFNNRSIFGKEFTFRQIMGLHFIEGKNYEEVYVQSKKILTLINKEVKKLFESFDVVLSPTTIDIAQKRDEWKKAYNPSYIQAILLMANFASCPAVSVPWEIVDGMPVGLHLMAGHRKDDFLFRVASYFSKLVSRQ